MSRGLPSALVAFATAFSIALLPLPASSAGEKKGASEKKKKKKTVLTYYGIRKLELDPKVSDQEKLKEWEEFIVRTRDHMKYAKSAVTRWKNAARLRVIEQVKTDDRSATLSAEQKIESWKRLQSLYPKSPEARLAKKRIAHWRAEHTKALVKAAEKVEKARGSKVERVLAWRKVSEWAKSGSEARAAAKRIGALERQLFAEAQSLDKIGRVDPKTKLDVWKDVLAAEPKGSIRKVAEKRVSELEAQLGIQKKKK